jgi:hypothetical protein
MGLKNYHISLFGGDQRIMNEPSLVLFIIFIVSSLCNQLQSTRMATPDADRSATQEFAASPVSVLACHLESLPEHTPLLRNNGYGQQQHNTQKSRASLLLIALSRGMDFPPSAATRAPGTRGEFLRFPTHITLREVLFPVSATFFSTTMFTPRRMLGDIRLSSASLQLKAAQC